MSSQITNPFSEKELIEEIKNGNKNAFQILFFQFYKKLISFTTFRTHDLEKSKDLVQDMFLHIWENRQKLNSNKSIKTYLYTALTNKIINLSKHSSSKTISINGFEIKTKTEQYELESDIDIFSAINDLPEKLKITFLLSRVENFKYSEIAEILNISVKAVEKRMTAALKELRKKIVE